MIKLAVFDVDGTMISEKNHQVSQNTIDTINKLHDLGIKTAVASGRPPILVKDQRIKDIDFDYYICSNGAYVMDKNENQIFKNAFSFDTIDSLVKDFIKNDEGFQLIFENGIYVYNGYKRMKDNIVRFIGSDDCLIDYRDKCDNHLYTLPWAGMCVTDGKNIDYYINKYPDIYLEEFAPNHYDLGVKNTTKASGIKHLCERIDCSIDEVIAFGDHLNDLEMIKQVGYGVAMGNALDIVKENSDYVTSCASEDGIVDACKHFNLI